MNARAPGGAPCALSVVIPVFNGIRTIEHNLAALYDSNIEDFEIVIVDDGSVDGTGELLRRLAARYPHRLIAFPCNRGVSRARNAGAEASIAETLLFLDADCIVQPDTIERCVARLAEGDADCIGGTYTKEAWDAGFFSAFQSLYVHYAETKSGTPDYVATHCMVIRKKTFLESGGFVTDSFIGHAASVEDVELSHRLADAGLRLARDPEIQVRHVFGFDFWASVRNAIKKSRHWTMYSIGRRDLAKDSGAASWELKVNVLTQALNLILLAWMGVTGRAWPLLPIACLLSSNVAINYRLFRMMRQARGGWFAVRAAAYYGSAYALAVAYGAGIGFLSYLWDVKLLGRYG